MPAISYKKFSGEIPRERSHLLPDTFAQLSQNVDHSDGSLAPLRDGLVLNAMLSNPVRGIFTIDGLNFYTWSVETQAFRCPIIDDSYNRFYMLQPATGVFQVGRTLQMAPNGPSPSGQIYRAGVPKAETSPTLALVELNTLRDYPGSVVSAEAWWDSGGTSYGRTLVALSMTTALRRYTFSAPTKPTGTPDGAVLVCLFKIKDAQGSEIASFTLRSGAPSRSSALPGTVEASLTSGTPCVIDLSWGAMETRAYTYTFENDIGEEGAPATPSLVSPTYLQAVRITVTVESFSGFSPLAKINVYRTYGGNASLLKTKVASEGAGTYLDASTKPSDVGTALESVDWYPSPLGLQGVELMPNGWFVGFKGNMLHMSEPYRPHAWPYSIPFQTGIRGVKAGQGNLVVTTADGVYVVQGAFPSSAQAVKLNLPQAGIAQRSMTSIDGAVAYASNDGIVLVQGSQVTTDAGGRLFTRKRWRERYENALMDASMTFGYHDGGLVMTSKSMNLGFLIRLDEEIGAYTRTTTGYDAMFLLPVTDTLYYSIGNTVYRYNAGSALTLDWRGKDFIYPGTTSFGAGFVAASGPVRVRIYANDALVYDQTVQPGYFRLPPILEQVKWSVRLTGSVTVTEFALARTMRDLRDV